MNPVLFWILATTMVVSALFVVAKRSPLASALALSVNLLALAGIFGGLSAPFLFIVQILVYAGAVIVLIVFVIMLLNLKHEDLKAQSIQRGKFAVAAVLCGIVALVMLRLSARGVHPAAASIAPDFGSVEHLAMELFGRYALSLEIVAVILLVGILGAVVLAKRGE